MCLCGSRSHARILRLTLVAMLVGISVTLGNESASAVDGAYGKCSMPERSVEQTDRLINEARAQSISTSGTLPTSSAKPDQPGASYSVEISEFEDVVESERIFSIMIDGVEWVDFNPFVAFDESGPKSLNFSQLAEITWMLRNWSACSVEPSYQHLLNFVSDFGVTWLFSRGDPFLASKSPAAAIMDVSGARTKGSLPLLLIEARELSDGRAALVIGEGALISDEGLALTPYISSSLWIVDRTSDGWKIDAIFGGFTSVIPQFIVI